jgi:hypothetical protein
LQRLQHKAVENTKDPAKVFTVKDSAKLFTSEMAGLLRIADKPIPERVLLNADCTYKFNLKGDDKAVKRDDKAVTRHHFQWDCISGSSQSRCTVDDLLSQLRKLNDGKVIAPAGTPIATFGWFLSDVQFTWKGISNCTFGKEHKCLPVVLVPTKKEPGITAGAQLTLFWRPRRKPHCDFKVDENLDIGTYLSANRLAFDETYATDADSDDDQPSRERIPKRKVRRSKTPKQVRKDEAEEVSGGSGFNSTLSGDSASSNQDCASNKDVKVGEKRGRDLDDQKVNMQPDNPAKKAKLNEVVEAPMDSKAPSVDSKAPVILSESPTASVQSPTQILPAPASPSGSTLLSLSLGTLAPLPKETISYVRRDAEVEHHDVNDPASPLYEDGLDASNQVVRTSSAPRTVNEACSPSPARVNTPSASNRLELMVFEPKEKPKPLHHVTPTKRPAAAAAAVAVSADTLATTALSSWKGEKAENEKAEGDGTDLVILLRQRVEATKAKNALLIKEKADLDSKLAVTTRELESAKQALLEKQKREEMKELQKALQDALYQQLQLEHNKDAAASVLQSKDAELQALRMQLSTS